MKSFSILQFVAIFDLAGSNGENAVKKLEEEFGKGRTGFYPCDITKVDQIEGDKITS